MIVLLASLLALGLVGAMLARLGRADDESRATALVRGALGSFTTLVVVQEGLGVAGRARPVATLVALGAVCAVVALATARLPRPRRLAAREPLTGLDAGLIAALVAGLATRLWHGLHRTTFLYDTLSYHLHAPATWMHDGRLSIVPAVFGDVAPAYAPSNVELFFWLLMAPLRSDFLAQAGQLPLAALACAAIAAAVREVGTPRSAALAAALAFLFVPEIWQQSATAMVDLGMAAFFLTALPFFVRLRERGRTADAIGFGLAVGLAAGTKVVGLVYGLVLVALALPSFVRAPRPPRAALSALVAAAVSGGFWYARNLHVTGNPLYPLALKLGGIASLPGLVDGAATRASQYHLPITDVASLGRMLLESGIGFCLAGAVGLARARRPAWGLLAVALVTVFWLVIPYQESRFLFPFFGVAAVAMAVRTEKPWEAALPALAIGASLVEHASGPRWVAVGTGCLVTFLFASLRSRIARRWWLTASAVVCGATGAEMRDAFRTYRDRDPAYDVGDDLRSAWSWTRANIHGARIAYTGNNLAFPLAGRDLANDVRYVNVSGPPTAPVHTFPPSSSSSSSPSSSSSSSPSSSSEPAPYRASPSYPTWLSNLRATRRDVLFVAALYPDVSHTIVHDVEGFPIERAWADTHPETFTLRFSSDAARVYAVAP